MARALPVTPPGRHKYNVESTSLYAAPFNSYLRRRSPTTLNARGRNISHRMPLNKGCLISPRSTFLAGGCYRSPAGKERQYFNDTLTDFDPRRRCRRGLICLTYPSPAP
jgi:hypothetical protein